MQVKPIRPKERVYEEIVEQIQQLIMSGKLKIGDQLPAERQLSADFKVSRTAVREAIKSLSEKGLVDIQVGRGTFVTNPSAEQVVDSLNLLMRAEKSHAGDLQTARILLEVPIAGLAARNRTNTDLRGLEDILQRMKDSLHHSAKAFIEADTDFHIALAKASKNTVLHILAEAIVMLIRKEHTFIRDFKSEYDSALIAHNLILEKVKDKDIEGAEDAMMKHIKRVGDALVRVGVIREA